MKASRTIASIAVAVTLLAGCRGPEADAPVTASPADQAATPGDTAQAPADAAPDAQPPAAAPAAASFDITAIEISDAPLPEWPYIALPVGYQYDDADDMASASKDLARVPVWTGTELLWIEGRTFSDQIDNDDGKSFSKFEVRRNLQQAVEALGGTRLVETSLDDAIYQANKKDIEDFRQEFADIRDAYWADYDADTYVIRRADKAIWIVGSFENQGAGLLVAEGPPPAPTPAAD